MLFRLYRAEAKDNNMAKFFLCVDTVVRVMEETGPGYQDLKVQDMITKLLESLGADRRTLPAPPSKKERKMRALVNARRARAVKKA